MFCESELVYLEIEVNVVIIHANMVKSTRRFHALVFRRLAGF